MIYEGMNDDAFAIIKGARDRYDGTPRAPMARNPWSEVECGGHYARAMSSWSLLLALSGFSYDGPKAAVRFTPRHRPDNFKSFFTGPEGWGSIRQVRLPATPQRNEITVAEGKFLVSSLHLDIEPRVTAGTAARVLLDGKPQKATLMRLSDRTLSVKLASRAAIGAGKTLTVELSPEATR